MRIAIDLDTREVRTWGGAAITELVAKRRDRFPVEVRFTRGGVVTELGSGATGILGVKTLAAFDADYLAAALSWVKSGSGTSTAYTFDLNLNTTEIGTAFSADPETIPAALEVEWLVGIYRESSIGIPLTISNDYIQGGEGVPATVNPPYPAAKNIPVLRLDITGKTGGTTADLDSISTAAINLATYPLLYLCKTGTGGGIQGWQLTAGTDAESAASGIVRPDDYATTTNEKVWKQVF
jgi:hypothetical protein